MYVSSYLATLNARGELREKMSDALSVHISELSRYPGHDTSDASGQKVWLSVCCVRILISV